MVYFFFFQAEDGIRDYKVTGVQTCALPISPEPLAHGVAGEQAYLLLEFLDLKGKGDFAALGRMLAAAHRKPGPRFGWKIGRASCRERGWVGGEAVLV